MADLSFYRDLAIGLVGTGVGMVPGLFRGWRSDRDKLVTDQAALANEIAARGHLEAKVERLKDDVDGIASSYRTRIKVLEKVFEERTGKMPKFDRDSGEQERTND